MYRFGITMRITNAVDYDEPRDSLAQDWSSFMEETFPNDQWLAIPNIGSKAVDYFQKWNLNVLILSGGDDLGKTKKRDETETLLLEHALKNNIPVIGVCRGMQLIHTHFGGELESGNEAYIAEHRAHDHQVILKNETHLSNSYHVNSLVESSLHNSFSVMARCEKFNSIEGFRGENLLAMMWHPEREMQDKTWSNDWIIKFLKEYE